MSLTEDLKGALAGMFSAGAFGESAIYAPAGGGAAVPVDVILREGNAFEADAMGTNPAATGTARVQESQVASPEIDDTITPTASGDAWRVVRVMSRSAGIFVLEVAREGRIALK